MKKLKLLVLSTLLMTACSDGQQYTDPDSDGLETSDNQSTSVEPATVPSEPGETDPAALPSTTDEFSTLPGELLSLTAIDGGGFEFVTVVDGGTRMEGQLDSEGAIVTIYTSTRIEHSESGLSTPNRYYVRTHSDSNYQVGNCGITAYDHFSTDPIFSIPDETASGIFCSMDTVDNDDNYYYAQGRSLISLDPYGNQRWDVQNTMAPGYGRVLLSGDKHVQLDLSFPPHYVYTRYANTGELVYNGIYMFPIGAGYEGAVEKFIGFDSERIFIVGDRAENACGENAIRTTFCHQDYIRNGRQLRILNITADSPYVIREWDYDADPGISNAIVLNNELVVNQGSVATVLNPETLSTTSTINFGSGEIHLLDDNHLYVSRYDGDTSVIHKLAR